MEFIRSVLTTVLAFSCAAESVDVKKTDTYRRLKAHLDAVPAIDTHDHLKPFAILQGTVQTDQGVGISLRRIREGSSSCFTAGTRGSARPVRWSMGLSGGFVGGEGWRVAGPNQVRARRKESPDRWQGSGGGLSPILPPVSRLARVPELIRDRNMPSLPFDGEEVGNGGGPTDPNLGLPGGFQMSFFRGHGLV